MDLYSVLKFFHILFAIAAVGANLTYGFWTTGASRAPEVLPHVLRRIRALDSFIANPSYALVLGSGIALVWVGRIGFRTTWVVLALALWVVMALLGVGLYSPALKRQIQALDRFGFHSPAYREVARRSTLLGLLVMVPVVLLLAVMVFKPTGWF